jgi:hypothetical protein
MVRNKHDKFLSCKKITSQENFISDDEISFAVYTTVMHSSYNTVQCYETVKAQTNTNCHTKTSSSSTCKQNTIHDNMQVLKKVQ